MDEKEIESKIIDIFVHKLKIDSNIVINTDFKLFSENGIDSLKFVKVIVEIENTFDIEVSDNDLNSTGSFVNIESITKYIINKLKNTN
ncbi:MAG: acyl carrier protein [bacterium]